MHQAKKPFFRQNAQRDVKKGNSLPCEYIFKKKCTIYKIKLHPPNAQKIHQMHQSKKQVLPCFLMQTFQIIIFSVPEIYRHSNESYGQAFRQAILLFPMQEIQQISYMS